jgi:hypothetical protein
MADGTTDSGDFTDDVIPPLAPPPTVLREFKAAPWHRPRKQYIRKYQWNKEIVTQIIQKRPDNKAESLIRVFGLPSSEYLDLFSMKGLCDEYQQKVLYLGFNASHATLAGSDALARRLGPVDLYTELQAQRMIEASSFVHPSSILYPDRFELLRNKQSQCRVVLEQFSHFDVINLDICGCIVDPNKHRATDTLEAVSELLRWQSTHRLEPWLFFVTSYSSPNRINREACKVLIDAIKANAEESPEFGRDFELKVGINPYVFHETFNTASVELPNPGLFIRVFALAFGKWLAWQLRKPTPPSLVSMLPSYCFRHLDDDLPAPYETAREPELLSLAYLVKPTPDPGSPGISIRVSNSADLATKYFSHAKQILSKSLEIADLDQLMLRNATAREEMANDTSDLLIGCGFDAAEVNAFLAKYR